jgi:hypothetical protein
MESPLQELPCSQRTAGALLEANVESSASKSVDDSPSAVADIPQYLRKSRLDTFILMSPLLIAISIDNDYYCYLSRNDANLWKTGRVISF